MPTTIGHSVADIGAIEPSASHYYPPWWTRVCGGRPPAAASKRTEASAMPQGVRRIKDRAEQIGPRAQTVSTSSGGTVHCDHLVVCPGIRKQAPVAAANLQASIAGTTLPGQLRWVRIPPADDRPRQDAAREFDYTMNPAPSIPLIDTTHERRDTWYVKRYGPPATYCNLIFTGRV